MKYQKLFTPIKIGSCEIKNRFAMAPMGPLGLSDSEGGWNQRGIDYYTERAKGGTGLIITGVTFSDCKVEPQSMPNCPNSTYNPVHFVRTSKEMTERIHAYGSKIFLMMSAGFGRVTIPTNLGEFPPVAPSAIPHRWLDKTCREISVDEIHAIVRQFGEAAFHAKRAGFDGVQIHAVHEGYLMDQFAISIPGTSSRSSCHILHDVSGSTGGSSPQQPAAPSSVFLPYAYTLCPPLFSPSSALTFQLISGRNRFYPCKKIHIFKNDQEYNKQSAVNIRHGQKCQHQHTGRRDQQAEFGLQCHSTVFHKTLKMPFVQPCPGKPAVESGGAFRQAERRKQKKRRCRKYRQYHSDSADSHGQESCQQPYNTKRVLSFLHNKIILSSFISIVGHYI